MSAPSDPAADWGLVFDASPDPILLHDYDTGHVAAANDAAAAFFDTSQDDLVGQPLDAVLSPRPMAAAVDFESAFAAARASGSTTVDCSLPVSEGVRIVELRIESASHAGDWLVTFVRDVTEPRRQEAELREQRLLREAVFNAPDKFVGLLDADGRLLEANQTALDFAGIERGEEQGKQFWETVWWRHGRGDSDRIESAVRQAQTGTPARFTTGHRSAGGEVIQLSVLVRPVVVDESVSYIVAEGTDITEQHEHATALKDRKEELEALVNNLPVVLFTLDASGTFTRSVGKGLAALGLEPGEAVGQSAFDLYADAPTVADAVERALDGVEHRTLHEFGDLVFEAWYKPIVTDGEVTEVIGIARDVSEMKAREARIEALGEASRELLFTSTPAEVARVVMDITTRIIDEDLAAMRQYDPTDDVLRPIRSSNTTADSPEDLRERVPVLHADAAEMAIFRSGETRYLEEPDLEGYQINTAGMESVFVVPLAEYGLLTVGSTTDGGLDETDRHLIEILARNATAALENAERAQEIAEYQTELERSNESLQQFAYVASHDLQEPLRMVASYVDLLETEYGDDLDEEAHEYMDYAVDGARRMKAMIDGLLDYSRVQTTAAEPEPVESAAVFADVRNALGLLIDDREATVETGSMPTVVADGDQLGQVFQNLVANAIEHGGDHPTIRVAGTPGDDDVVRFDVTDDGPGVPEAQRERLFEIFEQGDRNAGGSGIGLAVCQRIVHRHGGDIWIESAPGEGTTVSFTMPAPEATGEVTRT